MNECVVEFEEEVVSSKWDVDISLLDALIRGERTKRKWLLSLP